MDNYFRSKMIQAVKCKGIEYVVESGDTLYKIAKKYNLRVYDIIRANPSINVYNLKLGDKLCIPAEEAKIPKGTISYVIKNGDTLRSILDTYNLSYSELEEVNKEIMPIKFMPGLKILIPITRRYGRCSSGKEYVIGEGETIDTVAKMLNVTIDELLIANPNMTPKQFTTNTRICVPTQV